MFRRLTPHTRAVAEAILVTILWSSSWVLIKIGLRDIPALPFAGLRYTLAWLVLLPFALRSGRLQELHGLPRSGWLRLIALGLVFYTLTQGGQFLTLAYLPAVTFSLLLNFSAIIVALLGIGWLGERLSGLQWAGAILFIGGVLVYFYPLVIPRNQAFGLTIAGLTVLANALASLLGREVNRLGHLSPLTVTVVSMGIGALTLLVVGIAIQGFPPISLTGWLIVGWMALANTAFAFTLWNRTLRVLSAAESSIINNTMLIQIALLAWVFLGESITLREGIGLMVAAAGILIVQVRRMPRSTSAE